MKFLETLNSIHDRLDRLGDLPVFSATVNRISQISSSKKSNAMALAVAVMKDASLSTRLLRLANSSWCNRGNGRINVVSRAVVLLGFEQIKSISMTLKLIEGFKRTDAGAEIGELLMRSFMTATIAREIAELSGVDDVEETYICGLLHGLGETLVAYTRPDLYQQMIECRHNEGSDWQHIQLEVLGGHFSDIGQDIAHSWGFPQSVVQSMDLMTAEDHPGSIHSNYQLAASADQLLKLISNRSDSNTPGYGEILEQLESRTGQSRTDLTRCLHNAFRMACDMAEEYRLPKDYLTPDLRDSGDQELDEFCRKVAYYIHTRDRPETSESGDDRSAVSSPEPAAPASQLLEQLQIIGDMVSEQRPVQEVLNRVLEAIDSCTEFDRAAFCLISKDHQQLSLRIDQGRRCEDLRRFFRLSRQNREHRLFFRILERGQTLLVTDTGEADWGKRLPEEFTEIVAPAGFVLAPLGIGRKTIGFIYADRLAGGGIISDEDFRRFNQLFMQTRMALAWSSQSQQARQ